MTNTAIIKKSFREFITFAEPPSPATIQTLKRSGFEYANGQWGRVSGEGAAVEEAEVARIFTKAA